MVTPATMGQRVHPLRSNMRGQSTNRALLACSDSRDRVRRDDAMDQWTTCSASCATRVAIWVDPVTRTD
jgi:hypothetical protein